MVATCACPLLTSVHAKQEVVGTKRCPPSAKNLSPSRYKVQIKRGGWKTGRKIEALIVPEFSPPRGPQTGLNSVQVLAALSHLLSTAKLVSDKTIHTFQLQTTLQPEASRQRTPTGASGLQLSPHTHRRLNVSTKHTLLRAPDTGEHEQKTLPNSDFVSRTTFRFEF